MVSFTHQLIYPKESIIGIRWIGGWEAVWKSGSSKVEKSSLSLLVVKSRPAIPLIFNILNTILYYTTELSWLLKNLFSLLEIKPQPSSP
jgi:hypothetical protein